MKKLFLILLLLFSIKGFMQSKSLPHQKEVILKGTGWLKNYTGLESCSWIIELDKEGKEKLEPLNFGDFKISAADGKKIKFTYVLSNVNSTCMVGKTVKLKTIKLSKD